MFRTAARLPRLAVALTALSLSVAAQAATFNQALTTDGQWFNFTVDALSTADGRSTWIDVDYQSTAGQAQDLSFSFTVLDQAVLKVVDLYAAGDSYQVSISGPLGTLLTQTSSVAAQDVGSAPFVGDADSAWADASFSRGTWLLGAGTYTVTGSLLQSVSDAGVPLLSTAGAVSVTAVPEPTSLALALAALASMIFMSRRRR